MGDGRGVVVQTQHVAGTGPPDDVRAVALAAPGLEHVEPGAARREVLVGREVPGEPVGLVPDAGGGALAGERQRQVVDRDPVPLEGRWILPTADARPDV
ncbi:hypothetical protein GCM10027446_20200 [Angustibacter peucedani]